MPDYLSQVGFRGREAELQQGRDLANLPARGVSNFGFTRAKGNLPAQLHQGAVDRASMGFMEDLFQGGEPTLSNIAGQLSFRDIPRREVGEVTPEIIQGMTQKGLSQVIDFMNPVPISGLGTMIGKGAQVDFLQEAADKLYDLVKNKKMDVEKAFQKTDEEFGRGYFFGRGTDYPMTQISDYGTSATKSATLLSKDLNDITKLKRYMNSKAGKEGIPLPDVYPHPRLYANYPTVAANTKVRFSDKIEGKDLSVAAVDYIKWDSKGNVVDSVIYVNPQGVQRWAKEFNRPYDEILSETILHEIQHVIQGADNYPTGTSPKQMENLIKALPDKRKDLQRVEAAYKRYVETGQDNLAKKQYPRMKQLRDHVSFLSRVEKFDTNYLYRASLGEANAFWTQQYGRMKDVEHIMPLHLRSGQQQNTPNNYSTATKPWREEHSAILKAGEANVSPRIDTYHASKSFFDKFDLRNFSMTGEGADAYGYGLYLAASPTVSGPTGHYTKMFQESLNNKRGLLTTRIQSYTQRLNQPRGLSNVEAMQLRNKIAEMKKELKDTDWNAVSYKVHVPDEAVDRMLDMDLPIQQQPKFIQELADKIPNRTGPSKQYMTGRDLYKNLAAAKGGNKQASLYLLRHNIPGAKYFDGDSRSLGYGTKNYLLYDDTIPVITHRTRGGKTEIMNKDFLNEET